MGAVVNDYRDRAEHHYRRAELLVEALEREVSRKAMEVAGTGPPSIEAWMPSAWTDVINHHLDLASLAWRLAEHQGTATTSTYGG